MKNRFLLYFIFLLSFLTPLSSFGDAPGSGETGEINENRTESLPGTKGPSEADSAPGPEIPAGEDYITLEEGDKPQRIIITGLYDPLDPRSVSAQVSVLAADEIAASGARTAAEALESVPGIVLVRYGGRGQSQLVSLRGASSDKVLVLVNGRRINTAQGGGVDLSQFKAEDIERIEVIRGGRSAVYGSGAFGGVVNIVTKSTAGAGRLFTAYYGFSSQTTHEAGAGYSDSLGPDGTFSFRVSLNGLSSRGDYSYYSADYGDILRRENAEVLSGGGDCFINWKIFPAMGAELSLSGSHQSSLRGVPGMEGFPTPEALLLDGVTALALDLSVSPAGTLRVSASGAGREQVRGYNDDTHRNTSAEGSIEAAGVLSRGLCRAVITAGGTYRYDSLDSTALVYSGGAEDAGRAERHTASGYARSEIPLFRFKGSDADRIILSPAARYDYSFSVFSGDSEESSDYRFSFNGGLLFLFDPNRRFVFKANAGTSYNLPSFDDLFWLESGFALGNPNLLPEEGFQIDAGFILQPADPLVLEIVYYRQELSNLIQWNPGAGGVWRPRNIGAALVTGIEGEGRFILDLSGISCFLEGKANYTLLIAENREDSPANRGKQLPYRPKHQAGISFTFNHYGGHTLNLSGTYVGHRYTNEGNTRYLEDYFLIDLSLGLKIAENYEVSLFGKNLLNTPYISRLFYPVPGAEFGVKGRVLFR